MALDPQKTSSPEYREILVTDIAWVFDYGIEDSVTLREGDTIDHTSEPGWLVITLQPLTEGLFPEVIRHPVAKIIGERHQMRRMKVRITGPTAPTGHPEVEVPLPFADEASGSATGPVGRGLRDSGASPTPDTGVPEGLVAPTPQAPPTPRGPRPRRRASRRGPGSSAD